MKMCLKQIEGRTGEELASKYLESLGYKIICNNFRCTQGEIDVIAQDRDELVFIEVKTRSSIKFGEAKEAVNQRKQKHIVNAAKYYLYKTRQEGVNIRIDVMEVYLFGKKVKINHIKQAVWA